MSKLVLKDAQIIFRSSSTSPTAYDLSDHIANVTISTVHDLFETTQVGDTAKSRVPGLADNSVTFEFHQDMGAGEVEQIFNGYDNITSPNSSWVGTIAYCEIKPTSAAVSATNPKYTFDFVVSEWTPLNAAVGALSTINVTWPINGIINKFTT